MANLSKKQSGGHIKTSRAIIDIMRRGKQEEFERKKKAGLVDDHGRSILPLRKKDPYSLTKEDLDQMIEAARNKKQQGGKVKPQVINGFGTGPNYTAGETPWYKEGGSQNGPTGFGYQEGGEPSKKKKRKANF